MSNSYVPYSHSANNPFGCCPKADVISPNGNLRSIDVVIGKGLLINLLAQKNLCCRCLRMPFIQMLVAPHLAQTPIWRNTTSEFRLAFWMFVCGPIAKRLLELFFRRLLESLVFPLPKIALVSALSSPLVNHAAPVLQAYAWIDRTSLWFVWHKCTAFLINM